MTALTKDRNTPARAGDVFHPLVKAAALIHAGAFVCLDANGWAVPASTALGLVPIGRAGERADNSDGLDGDIRVKVLRGVFRWENSAAGDAITQASIGDAAYLVDDQTVAKTDGGGTRSRAGSIIDVDDQGVWVLSGYGLNDAPGGALLAANNGSDFANKGTTRANLGVAEKFGAPAFVIGAEAGNAISVAIQLKDAAGADLAVRGSVFAYLSDDANGDALAAAAPSGGVAIGVDGLAIPLVAGKTWLLTSEADGDIDLTITEAGAKTCYLVLVMPDGRLAVSGAITFA